MKYSFDVRFYELFLIDTNEKLLIIHLDNGIYMLCFIMVAIKHMTCSDVLLCSSLQILMMCFRTLGKIDSDSSTQLTEPSESSALV